MFDTVVANKKMSVYYLCDRCSPSDRFLFFEATFSETSQIKRCFICAASLHHAMFILYDQLSSIWSKEYLDNHLLTLSFSEVYNHGL